MGLFSWLFGKSNKPTGGEPQPQPTTLSAAELVKRAMTKLQGKDYQAAITYSTAALDATGEDSETGLDALSVRSGALAGLKKFDEAFSDNATICRSNTASQERKEGAYRNCQAIMELRIDDLQRVLHKGGLSSGQEAAALVMLATAFWRKGDLTNAIAHATVALQSSGLEEHLKVGMRRVLDDIFKVCNQFISAKSGSSTDIAEAMWFRGYSRILTDQNAYLADLKAIINMSDAPANLRDDAATLINGKLKEGQVVGPQGTIRWWPMKG